MYQALYRKYRPKNFDEVVGQEHITATLKQEIASGRIGHAYLFTGSRGTGKTSCSKIIAKAVNCPNQHDGNPCGVCDICKGIDDGSVLDVTEIDAASNNGVDNIRQLREEANFTPAQVSYRVYIIDETHMLSVGAFNALLKIMEEPPAHVVFILATTEVHKIPATILSRCQRFDFYRIPRDAIASRLEYIAGKEGFTVTREAAELIAGLSDGALRDAISLLDLCSSYSREITRDTVLEASGTVGTGHLYDLADAAADGDTARALAIAGELSRRSMDESRLCEQLIGHYRDLMLTRAVQDPTPLLDTPSLDLQRLRAQSDRYSMERILYSIEVLQEALGRMSRSAERRTELEVTLIKLCDPRLSTRTDALLSRIEKLESALRAGAILPQTPAAARPAVQEEPELPEIPDFPDVMPAPEQPAPKEKPAARAEAPAPEEQKVLNWREVLDHLEKKNPALAGALVGSSAYRRGGYVLIDCRDDFFLKLMRENDYARECIKQAFLEVNGTRCSIGPYRRPVQEKKEEDPLATFIETLDLPQERVQID